MAKIVKIRGVDEGDTVDEKNKPSVIAFLLDLRTNEWEECIEINNPEAKKYMQVEYNIVPKNILPEPILKYATSRFKI